MFNENEVQIFERMWLDLTTQFNCDVYATEELQIEQLIQTRIMMNQTLIAKKAQTDEIERYEKLLEVAKLEDAINEAEKQAKIEALTQYIHQARAALKSYTDEWTKLNNECKNMLKDLKGTREQRIQTIKDSKQNFSDYLIYLEEEENRKKENFQAEILRESMERCSDRLSEEMKYENGEYDRPLLTPETILKELKKEIKNEEEDWNPDAAPG